ncbi:MAG: pseudouridine synthase [Anaerolineae bacterium]|nr:pseudouridine synthase [Anaerolineae bacterium]
MAYKPYGVLSIHHEDPLGRRTLTAMGIPTTLSSAGRLDLDSEGLLVLTDDGQTLHRLTHPAFSHAKTYFVLVLGHPDVEALRSLRQGVEIKLGRTRPADVEILANAPPLPHAPVPQPPPDHTTWLRIVLHEGMNRQIKRMTAAVGHPTVRLTRVAVGHVTLPPDLAPGTWREMTAVERKVLLDDAWPNGRRAAVRRHRL